MCLDDVILKHGIDLNSEQAQIIRKRASFLSLDASDSDFHLVIKRVLEGKPKEQITKTIKRTDPFFDEQFLLNYNEALDYICIRGKREFEPTTLLANVNYHSRRGDEFFYTLESLDRKMDYAHKKGLFQKEP